MQNAPSVQAVTYDWRGRRHERLAAAEIQAFAAGSLRVDRARRLDRSPEQEARWSACLPRLHPTDPAASGKTGDAALGLAFRHPGAAEPASGPVPVAQGAGTGCAPRRRRSPNSGHEINSPVRWRLLPSALALLLTAKGTSVILVLNQYKCIGCSPRKHSDTRTMAIGSDDDSVDSVHDRGSCISV